MRQEGNMLIYFLGKLVPAACVLFIMVAGVRFLGKSEFGRYNLLFNCINITAAFCIGWIQQSMLRFGSGQGEEQNHQQKQFFLYTVISSGLAFIVILLLSIFYFGEPFFNSLLISAFGFVWCTMTVRLTFLQSQFRSRQYAITESAFYLVTIFIISLIMYYSMPAVMIYFYAAWLIAGISWLAVECVRHWKNIFSYFRTGFDASFFKKSFHYGYLITAWLLVSNLFNVVDRFIIRHYFDFEQVGVYSVVYDFIYRLTSFAALPILLTLHPLIMKTWNEDRKGEAMALVKKAVLLLLLLLTAELILYFFLGDWIFEKFFHLESPGLMVLVVPLVISSVLWQMSLFLHKPLELLFRQGHMIAGIVISLLSNIVLNFIFVPVYGFESAAYTTLASTLIYIVYVSGVVKLMKKEVA